MSAKTLSDCEVTQNDQILINRFARLNAKCEELDSDLSQKKRQLDNTEEALNELILQSDHVMIHSGEVLAQMTTDGAQEWCEKIKQQLEESVSQINSSLNVWKQEMLEIKAKLYAKFGSNINLEYDD